MYVSLQKFVNAHLSIIVLVIFNIIILVLFAILYFLCDFFDKTSFNNTKTSQSHVSTIIDHFLLSCAIQSGVGYANTTLYNDKAKLLVFIQQFIVMTSTLLSIYLFIYFSTKK